MKTTRKLSSGVTGFYNDQNQFVCTGSAMGRRNSIPSDPQTVRKLHLRKLQWVDGDYDEGGAYWGNTGKNSIYWAFGDSESEQVEMFVRAVNREDAKQQVLEKFPNARFFDKTPVLI